MVTIPESTGKVRAGKAPSYVVRAADPCTCGVPLVKGDRGVWVRYTRTYPPPERCPLCQGGFEAFARMAAYKSTTIIAGLSESSMTASEQAAFRLAYKAALAQVQATIQRDGPAAHIGLLAGACNYHYWLLGGETRRAKEKTLRFRAFHVGCQVNGAIKDPDLRVRVINMMRRQPGGNGVQVVVAGRHRIGEDGRRRAG